MDRVVIVTDRDGGINGVYSDMEAAQAAMKKTYHGTFKQNELPKQYDYCQSWTVTFPNGDICGHWFQWHDVNANDRFR